MEAKLKATTIVVVMALTLGVASGFGLGPLATQPGLCNMSQDGFMACKPWVTTSVAVPPTADPSAACCAALAVADMGCLCSYRNSMMLPALGIDPKLAMLLPKKCNIVPPPQC